MVSSSHHPFCSSSSSRALTICPGPMCVRLPTWPPSRRVEHRFCKPASHHSYRPRTTRSTVSGPTYCRCHSSQKHIVIHVQTERSGCSECVTAPSDRSTSAGPECGDARRACYTSRCTACRHTTNDIQLTVLFTFSIHNSDSTSRCLKSANPKSEIQEARRYSRSGRGIFISSLI